MRNTNLLLIATFIFMYNMSFSQNRISVSNRSPIYLDFSRPVAPGAPKQSIIDDSQWLNFTSLVNINDPTLTITAQVVGGTLPEGVELIIEALPYRGMSKANNGVSSGKVKLTNTPRVLISNIGTCYTGNGRNEGFQLRFTFRITDYSKLKAERTALYIEYTITQ